MRWSEESEAWLGKACLCVCLCVCFWEEGGLGRPAGENGGEEGGREGGGGGLKSVRVQACPGNLRHLDRPGFCGASVQKKRGSGALGHFAKPQNRLAGFAKCAAAAGAAHNAPAEAHCYGVASPGYAKGRAWQGQSLWFGVLVLKFRFRVNQHTSVAFTSVVLSSEAATSWSACNPPPEFPIHNTHNGCVCGAFVCVVQGCCAVLYHRGV